jgi:hypothetical protein
MSIQVIIKGRDVTPTELLLLNKIIRKATTHSREVSISDFAPAGNR